MKSTRKRVLCELCHKRKKRCERLKGTSECYYCVSLRRECSLKYEVDIKEEEIEEPQESPQTVSEMFSAIMNELQSKDRKIGELAAEMKALRSEVRERAGNLEHPQKRMKRGSFTSNELIDDSVESIQLNFFSEVALKVVGFDHLQAIGEDYTDFLVECNRFVELYKAKESVYSYLAEIFLQKSHFWIIPGGIKKINLEYVKEHPFISCVFVLIGVCFLDSDTYVEEQKEIFKLTRDLAGKAILLKRLTDHDIEAMVYLISFNICRLSSDRQHALQNEVIASVAVVHSQITFNFRDIFARIFLEKKFRAKDLFHMRIFSSLQTAHIQACLEYLHPVTTTSDFLLFPGAILKFPSHMILTGDRIAIAKLQLLTEVTRLIYDSDFSVQVLKDINQDGGTYLSGQCLRIPALELWKIQHKALIKKDTAKVLLHAYYHYYVYISQRILQDLKNKHSIIYPVQQKKFPFERKWILTLKRAMVCTVVKYCCTLLKSFFTLQSYFIEGLPMFQTDQIIYACHKLMGVLDYFPSAKTRTLIFSYVLSLNWRLSRLETRNEAMDKLEDILKKMVSIANSHRKEIPPEETVEGEFEFSDIEHPDYAVDHKEIEKYEKSIAEMAPPNIPQELQRSASVSSARSTESTQRVADQYKINLASLDPLGFALDLYEIGTPDPAIDPNIALPNTTSYSNPEDYMENFFEVFEEP